jgi:transglutaminase-like putative cysteine protease
VAAALAVPVVLAIVLAAYASAALDPLQRSAYSLQERHQPVTLPAAVTNPLNEIADRLSHPDDVVFVNRTAAPVDRWPVTVLDVFDGVNWTTSARFRPMGGTLEPEHTAVPTLQGNATIKVQRQPGPWLPTQFRPRQVAGVEALIDPATGVLITPAGTSPRAYRLQWEAPNITAGELAEAQVDTSAGSLSLGQVPSAVVDLARQAVGGSPPSFQAALILEKWLRDNYRTANGDALPTGHGYAQLQHFLNTSKRGTSEQFATAYVVLARSVGIPARLVAGFRQPPADGTGDHTVRNSDALAWPEVAVRGVGWIPLDPTNGTTSARDADTGLAAATEKARKDLPQGDNIEPGEVPPAPPPEPPPPPPPVAYSPGWYWVAGVLLAVLVIGWTVGVPLFKRLRGHRRRSRSPDAAVIGAWWEVRDLLRDHGIAARLGMTVRDLLPVAQPVLGPAAQGGLDRLARSVDHTLWSGLHTDRTTAAQAWSGVDAVRDALRRRPWLVRLRAHLAPRSLMPPLH